MNNQDHLKNPNTIDWKQFWSAYRNVDVETVDDLLFQVGRTIEKRPISNETYQLLVQRIIDLLQLNSEDLLLDLCCGNGLMSFDLATYAGKVVGVDFADHLIETAKRLKARENITYFCANAQAPLGTYVDSDFFPSKILMNAGLMYFDPSDLKAILDNFLTHNAGRGFRALFTDVPNEDWKWNFYNTPERKARFLENQKRPLNDNDGLGRWWSPDELTSIAQEFGMILSIHSQRQELTNYRMDVLLLNEPSKKSPDQTTGATKTLIQKECST